jgi:hypothetical protein
MGLNGTYGFQFALTPTLPFTIQKTSTGSPLKFQVTVAGTGHPLANASLTYSLIVVDQNGVYPSYNVTSGKAIGGKNGPDGAGWWSTPAFLGVDGENNAYAFIVYAYLDGLKGVGYYISESASSTKAVVPLIDSFQDRTVLLTHSDSFGSTEPPVQLSYNASFVILTEEYTLRRVDLEQPAAVGELGSEDYASLTVPDNDGILIVTYKDTTGHCGIALMPWGLGALAFPVVFGGDPTGRDWVTTDLRQVTIGGLAYQAKLALWSLQGSGSG